ncbi:DgyrCDS14706 [Dimorphilus gyrociliatus]|uniref:DgyrCDS14706 n=1 Tax=Dimorphilus gyrociliatus TaxID=2664684 RepID=A0A7I8WEL0_9ANNE|nr:DgyrCDS14706 [Dimorphilus gyrociliatus]
MYETPNFESKFQNRWKATPGVESSSYTFTVDKSKKTDGMRIKASIADGTSTDSVETGIAIYDSIPRIIEYPKDFSPEEGEEFMFSCEFNYWGSGHSEFQIFLNDKKIHYKFSKVIFIDGLITLKANLSASKEMNDNNIYCQLSLHRTDGKSSLHFKSQPIKFQVLYKVNDINISSEIGKTEIELSCSAVGNPPPKYEWRKVINRKMFLFF